MTRNRVLCRTKYVPSKQLTLKETKNNCSLNYYGSFIWKIKEGLIMGGHTVCLDLTQNITKR